MQIDTFVKIYNTFARQVVEEFIDASVKIVFMLASESPLKLQAYFTWFLNHLMWHHSTLKWKMKTRTCPVYTVTNENSNPMIKIQLQCFFTVVSRSRAWNLSSCVAADRSNDSCFFSSSSTAANVSYKTTSALSYLMYRKGTVNY